MIATSRLTQPIVKFCMFLVPLLMLACVSTSENSEERLRAARQQFEQQEQARIDSLRKRGVPISISYSTSDPNSVGGVDFEVAIENLTRKTIKYVQIGAVAYNGVRDKAKCEIRKTASIEGKITGPIEPGERSSPKGVQNAWYNPTIKCAKITNITLIFMDNTRLRVKDIGQVLVEEQPECP